MSSPRVDRLHRPLLTVRRYHERQIATYNSDRLIPEVPPSLLPISLGRQITQIYPDRRSLRPNLRFVRLVRITTYLTSQSRAAIPHSPVVGLTVPQINHYASLSSNLRIGDLSLGVSLAHVISPSVLSAVPANDVRSALATISA